VVDKLKTNVFVSDGAWAKLVELGLRTGYIRGIEPKDRPRGMSAFVTSFGWQHFEDSRPEWMMGTGQWCEGIEPFKQRCLTLSAPAIRDLCLQALHFEIYPYKTQKPILDGHRQRANIPVLHGVGATPPGSTSVLALIGPFLEAIGVGYLRPVVPLAQAPPSLYMGPSRRERDKRRRERLRRDVA
jgi:hypothetical protein